MKKHLLSLLSLFVIATSLCKAQIFYGMTLIGGSSADSHGAIISFDAAINKENVVWNFTGSPSDGAAPYGNLVYDSSNGLFYGMTYYGGSNDTANGGYGTIISFNPTTNKDSLVWSFAGAPSDGNSPFGDLVYDAANGLLYGMAEGGDDAGGTIISFNPATNKDSVVWNFTGKPDGFGPEGDLVYDASNGLFYGMTTGGGSNINNDLSVSCGTIISFNPATNKDSVVWNFGSGEDGLNPLGSLAYVASTGLFYGMTHYGGTNDTANGGWGTIFSFDPSKNKESVLWSFAGAPSDGEYPFGSFVYDTSNGLLYAMTYDGGANYAGAIISLDPSTNKERVVWSLGSGTDGKVPIGNLVYDWGNELLYAMTQWGGTNGSGTKDGTIISFNPNGNSEHVLWDFGSGTDGQQPWGSLVLYRPSVGAGIKQLTVDNGQLTVYPNPTSGEFTIKSNGNQKGYTLEVYNLMGEEVYESVLNNSKNSVNLNNQPDGLYFVYLKSDEGVKVEKVLVTR